MQPEEGVPYASAPDFERALVDRIASAAESAPYGVAEIRRQFAYGRLLARVFTHAPDDWVVKGAAGLLARIPGRARHSIDVDSISPESSMPPWVCSGRRQTLTSATTSPSTSISVHP